MKCGVDKKVYWNNRAQAWDYLLSQNSSRVSSDLVDKVYHPVADCMEQVYDPINQLIEEESL